MTHATELHAADLRPPAAHEDLLGDVMRLVRAGWQRVGFSTRRPAPLAMVAALAILGLLLTFHQVVQGAVHRAELRRAAAVQHAQALRRCQALPEATRRTDCLLALNAASARVAPAEPGTR